MNQLIVRQLALGLIPHSIRARWCSHSAKASANRSAIALTMIEPYGSCVLSNFRRELIRTVDADDEPADVIRVLPSGATQSLSATFGLPESFFTCWRRVWKRQRSWARDVIRPHDDVVPLRVGREKSIHAARRNRPPR
jgi:hypothetical protein